MQTRVAGAVLVAEMPRRIDASNAKALETEFLGLINAGQLRIAADFTACEYCSSAGLRVLLLVLKSVKPQGGRVGLFGLQTIVREVLEISGFVQIIEV